MKLTFEEVKENAGQEINRLIWENLSSQLKNLTNLSKYEKNLYKIINYHIEPVFENIIEKNEKSLKEYLEKVNNEEISKEDKQYKMNEKINSLLSMWKKTILTVKMTLVSQEGGKYLKSFLTDTTKVDYKKREKILKNRIEFVKKYKLETE